MSMRLRSTSIAKWGIYALALTAFPGHGALPRDSDADALTAFQNAISGMESRDGAYSAALPEQLLSLGHALQREGRHSEAVNTYKRGSHLSRINDGLNSPAQIPYLEGEIVSHLALGELQEADDGQSRLFRVQQRNSTEETMALILQRQAHWQHRAFNLRIESGEASYGRLVSMSDFYLRAYVNIRDREGLTSANLMPPLRGMLQAVYLISGYQENARPQAFDIDSSPSDRRLYNRFYTYYTQSFKRGQAIIAEMRKIQAAHHGEQSLPPSQTLVMLGDWMLWNGRRESAYDAYLQAHGELAELDDAQVQIARLFGRPQALPDLDGVRPLPSETSVEHGGVLLGFGVTRRGMVVDVERLYELHDGDSEISERQVNRLIRTLRKTKFRPRFDQGEASPTENIVRAYDITNQL